jgi:hypothetical protein
VQILAAPQGEAAEFDQRMGVEREAGLFPCFAQRGVAVRLARLGGAFGDVPVMRLGGVREQDFRIFVEQHQAAGEGGLHG